MIADKNKQIALFRYGIISDLINRKQRLKYGEKEKLLRGKLNCTWKILYFGESKSKTVLIFL